MTTLKIRWWIRGLIYGTIMFLFTRVIFPITAGEELETKQLLLGFVFWELAGLAYGYGISKFIENEKKTKPHNSKIDTK